MSRKIQFSVDEFYHVYNRGTEKRKIFLVRKDYERFIALLYLANNTEIVHLSNYQGSTLMDFLAISRGNILVDIGAYCLMPNHFHLLVKEVREGGLSAFMQKLITAYTMYFNLKYERSGALFSGRFKAQHADNDPYLQHLFVYLHLNPIKLVESEWQKEGVRDIKRAERFLKTYRYSSYQTFLGMQTAESAILNRASFPDYFQTPKEFSEFINEWLKISKEGANIKVEP